MTQTVFGIQEMNKILEDFAPKHANNLAKGVIHGLASEVVKEAKKRVPKNTGNLKKSIKAKRRRGKPGKPISDVLVATGKAAKNDGFYWRFVEFGTGGKTAQAAQPFLTPAKNQVSANLDEVLEKQFIKKLAAAVKREQKKTAKALK